MGKQSEATNHHMKMLTDFKRRFYVSLVLTVPVLLLSETIQGIFRFKISFPGAIYISFLISSLIFFYGGVPFFKGFVSEMKTKTPGMMTLITLAISIAYIYSVFVVFLLPGKVFFWELATLIDIMLIGHFIEMKSVMGASAALKELARLLPSTAHLVKGDGTIVDKSITELSVGDVVLVKPGETIPSDGIVINGESAVNESLLTGESAPVNKKIGSVVIGGSVNQVGAIKVRIEKLGKDTYLSQIMSLVKSAQESKSRTQDIANRAAFWLTLIAITVGFTTLFSWLVLGKTVIFALERAVTVMVITCPHALGLAVPLVVAISTSIGAKSGLLIRDRSAFENARNLDIIVFDKTGTLTKGNFAVSKVTAIDGIPQRNVISIAASVENNSEHPIAKGILEKAKKLNADTYPVSDFEAIPGKGIKATVQGKIVELLSPIAFFKSYRKNETIEKLISEGKTNAIVVVSNEPVGVITLSDEIRQEAFSAVKQLRNMGIKTAMLTGDNAKVAKWVAEELGLDDYFAEVLPNEKENKIKELRKKGLKVGMVGDGINDAPALVSANVGIAIGAGTNVAIESADIVLVKDNILDVVSLIKLARATYRKIKQNLFWAVGYNAFAIPLAAGVLYSYGFLLSPAAGAVLMSMSTVIVAINAKLLGNVSLK